MWNQILIGSILGDAHLRYSNERSKNVHYEENHSLKQKDYLLWKKSYFDEVFRTKVDEASYFDRRTNKTYHRIRLRMGVSPHFTKLHNVFYSKGKKVLVPSVLNLVDSLGLAVWYCDDGSFCYQNRRSKLGTLSFTLAENQLIQKFLDNRFGLKNIVYPNGSHYEIQFNVKNTNKLFSIISPFILESLQYKVGKDYERNKKVRAKAKAWEIRNKEKRQKQLQEWKIKNRARYLEIKRDYYYRHRGI